MNFTIDKEKCIKCKLCASDCPVLIINHKTEFPEIKEGKEPNCLKCQHCLAVCPTSALSIWGKHPENSIPVSSSIPKSHELENLMQTRRSVRKFKKEEVEVDLIHRLISMASYAPTAKNENAVQFTVVDNRQDMAGVRDLTYNTIKAYFEENKLAASMLHLNNYREVWEAKQIDIIFRDAPHMLITSAPKNGTEPVVDCTIAITYFELLANSNNIGTLWNGFAKSIFEELAPELKQQFGIPNDHKITAVIVFGKSAIKFERSIQNDNPAIQRISIN